VGTLYTTAVVNFITWNAAYSIFPDLTFIKRSTYQLVMPTPYFRKLVTKYGRRGWKTQETVRHEDRQNTRSLGLDDQEDSARRIGDPYTWKIDLNINGITPGAPSSVVEHSFFALKRKESTRASPFCPEEEPPRYGLSYYERHTFVFTSCVLKYQYYTNGINGQFSWFPISHRSSR
jgi:hypothetical protein